MTRQLRVGDRVSATGTVIAFNEALGVAVGSLDGGGSVVADPHSLTLIVPSEPPVGSVVIKDGGAERQVTINPNLTALVAEAAERAFNHSPSDDPWEDVALAATSVLIDYMLAQGSITDDEIEDCGRIVDVPSARELIARAVTQATGPMEERIYSLTESWLRLNSTYGQTIGRESARRQIAERRLHRIWSLCHERESDPLRGKMLGGDFLPALITTEELRAILLSEEEEES